MCIHVCRCLLVGSAALVADAFFYLLAMSLCVQQTWLKNLVAQVDFNMRPLTMLLAYCQLVCVCFCMLSKNKRPYLAGMQPPAARLKKNLGDVYSANHLPAARTQELFDDIRRAGVKSFDRFHTSRSAKARTSVQKNSARIATYV